LVVAVTFTPCVPLSLKGEGEEFGRGASPLLDAPDYCSRVEACPPLGLKPLRAEPTVTAAPLLNSPFIVSLSLKGRGI